MNSQSGVSVSYTHLDVYKRQVVSSPLKTYNIQILTEVEKLCLNVNEVPPKFWFTVII